MKICPKCAARFDQPDWICPTCDHQPALWQGCYLLNEPDSTEIEGYRGEYFAPLTAIEAGHLWFETRNRLINWGLNINPQLVCRAGLIAELASENKD